MEPGWVVSMGLVPMLANRRTRAWKTRRSWNHAGSALVRIPYPPEEDDDAGQRDDAEEVPGLDS